MGPAEQDVWVATYAAVRARLGPRQCGWPTDVPPLRLSVPDAMSWRAVRSCYVFRVFALVSLACVLGAALAAAVWWPTHAGAAGVVGGFGVLLGAAAMRLGLASVIGDERSLRIRQPVGSIELPWSSIEAVQCPTPKRSRLGVIARVHRVTPVVVLVDGTVIAPWALATWARLHTEKGVARSVLGWWELNLLWRRYGPAGAAEMWGDRKACGLAQQESSSARRAQSVLG